jgi:hypothetical protein
LFGHELELLALIWWDAMVVINMDDLNVWIQTCEQWATSLWCVIPMAMEKLAIAQHRIHCVIPLKWSGWPQIQRFEWGDYVYMQQITSIILDVSTWRVILHVQKVLPFGVLLEGWNG